MSARRRRPFVLASSTVIALPALAGLFSACSAGSDVGIGGGEEVGKVSEALGNFPTRVTAPYVPTYTSVGGTTDLTTLSNNTGNKFWTLAFVINQAGSYCTPSFNGSGGLNNGWGNSIGTLRSNGGDAIISLGGYGGTELGYSCSSVADLQNAYQAVINQFGAKSLDFDIEDGDTVTNAVENTTANDMRNQALHNLQAANPGLQISYTLGVYPTGLPQGQLNILTNAKSRGVNVSIVNIMAMDYGTCGQNMGQDAINAAAAVNGQLSSNGISAQVGVTPMVGTNDTSCEVFSTTDAQNLLNYAQSNSYIGRLAYWSQGTDTGTFGNAYINIFKAFNSSGGGGGGCTEASYGGGPWAMPGKIEAENYDTSGENVGYYDTTSGNSGGQYRTDDVDIETTSDTGGGYDVGWTAAGEWLKFTSNAASAGTQNVSVRVASTSAGQSMHVEIDGTNVTGAMAIPNTGGWQTWATVTSPNFSVSAGSHTVRAVLDTGGINLNYLQFASVSSGCGTYGNGGNPWAIPGQIEAENYDTCGANTSYYDTTAGNSGGQYRSDDVDIEATTDTGGGYNVGWTAAGEWLKYGANVGSSGNYNVSVRVAATTAGQTMHVEVDGANVSGSLSIPNTGAWQTWATVTSPNFSLSAGSHAVRVVMDTGGLNLNWVKFASASSCTPTTCSANGWNCGTPGDGCGGTLNCGSCTSPQTCGGGGTANVCGGGGGGGGGGTCAAAYSQSSCNTYVQGTVVSTGGHNWLCSNGNCANCAGYSSCAPGGSGCPWGVVWTDNGACN